MPTSHHQPAGKGKFLLVFGLVVFTVSAAIFLGFAWPKLFPGAAPESPAPAVPPPLPATADIPSPPPAPIAPEPRTQTDIPVGPEKPPPPIVPSIPAVVGPIQPAAVMEKLANAFLAEEPAAIQAALGTRVVTEATMASLTRLFGTHDLNTADAVSQLGSQPSLQRWAIYLKAHQSVGRGPENLEQVELDFVRDNRGQWWPGAIKLPGDDEPAPVPTNEAEPEALAIAHAAAAALVSGTMADLLPLVDLERFSPTQATGLAIMLQEGGFSLKPDAAPMVTLAGPTQVWLMIPILSARWQTESGFGLILRKMAESTPWRIVAFNTDSLTAITSNRLAAGEPATSLIRNPGQPDALCLYFAPESAAIDERSGRVLSLAAAMLQADLGLRVRLAGHTDATEKDGFDKKLSLARMEAAAKLLVEAGIPAEIISRDAHGSQRPRRANFLPDGSPDPRARALNRRVELTFER